MDSTYQGALLRSPKQRFFIIFKIIGKIWQIAMFCRIARAIYAPFLCVLNIFLILITKSLDIECISYSILVFYGVFLPLNFLIYRILYE